MSQVRIDHIKVGDRTRRDLGDLGELVASINEVGLLQPVVLDKEFNLIAGLRRLEAYKQMGRSQIEVRVVGGLQDAVLALKAERDENTCRKDFTPTEAVEIGRRIQETLKPVAEERHREGSQRGGMRRQGQPLTDSVTPCEPVDLSAIAASAVGMGKTSYTEAKAVVQAAEDNPATFGDLPAEMDRTGNVHGTNREMKRRAAKSQIVGGSDRSKPAVQARRDNIRRLAASGHSQSQIAKQLGISEDTVRSIAKEHDIDLVADKVLGRSRRVDANRVVESTVMDLDASMTSTHALMEGRYADLDPEKVAGWVASLETSRKSLSKFIADLKSLKETTRA